MNTDHILSQILGGGAASAFAGALAGGLASDVLTSQAGRKLAPKALQGGGLAAIGGLAYAAWSRYQREQLRPPAARSDGPLPPVPASALERFVPEAASAEAEALGLTLLRAMLAAARADGRLDPVEFAAIREHAATLELPEQERMELLLQIDRPVDIERLVAAATTPERAVEIYGASLLAIDVGTAAERAYLAMLAARLDLPEALVASLHREAGVAPPNLTASACRERAA